MKDFEKLGVFYLGRESDPAGKTPGEPLLYDSRDMVTHALCVGMTGQQDRPVPVADRGSGD